MYAVPTAVNSGSELLIFVPRAAHGHNLWLSFLAGRLTGGPMNRCERCCQLVCKGVDVR